MARNARDNLSLSAIPLFRNFIYNTRDNLSFSAVSLFRGFGYNAKDNLAFSPIPLFRDYEYDARDNLSLSAIPLFRRFGYDLRDSLSFSATSLLFSREYDLRDNLSFSAVELGVVVEVVDVLYFVDVATHILWRIDDVTDPGAAVRVGGLPVAVDRIRGLTGHPAGLYGVSSAGLWDIDPGDPFGGTVFLGAFPAAMDIPRAAVLHDDDMLYVTTSTPDAVWRGSPANPGGFERLSGPDLLGTSPFAIASLEGVLYYASEDSGDLYLATITGSTVSAVLVGRILVDGGFSIPSGMTSRGGGLFVLGFGRRLIEFEVSDLDATVHGNLPAGLSADALAAFAGSVIVTPNRPPVWSAIGAVMVGVGGDSHD